MWQTEREKFFLFLSGQSRSPLSASLLFLRACVCAREREKKKEIRMSNLPPALSQHLALMIMNWGLFKLLFALVILAVVTAVQTGPSSILGRATRLKLASGASCV